MNLYYKFKRGRGYILLVYTHKSQRIELSPSIICAEGDFGDGKKDNPIKKTDSDYHNKNTILRLFKENVYLVINKLKSERIEPTTELVKLGMKQFRKDLSITKHIETTIDRFPVLYVLKEKYIKSLDKNSTHRSIVYRVKIIEDFIRKRGDELLDFREIDVSFYNDFENYLVKREFSNSTSAKVISQFRQFLNFAIRENYTSKAYNDYKTKLSLEPKNPLTLSTQQIIELLNFKKFDYSSNLLDSNQQPIYLQYYEGWYGKSYLIKDELFSTIKDSITKKSKRDKKGALVGMIPKNEVKYYTTYEVVKDILLFSIATGLRWSDCCKIKVGDKDINKSEYSVIQQKTRKHVPIIENLLSEIIYRKYSKGKSSLQYLFPFNCKQNDFSRLNYLTKVNEHLKKIGEILKFNNLITTIKSVGKLPTKNPSVPFYNLITFHIGRRTHATIGAKNVDMKSISQQMGHSNISMTGIYISKDDEKLKKLFDFIEPNDSKIEKSTTKEPETKPSIVEETTIEEKMDRELEILQKLFEKGRLTEKLYSESAKKVLKKYNL